MVNGLSFTSIFLLVGLFYFVTGFYYRLPSPAQPLKVVSATGLLFGVFLVLLACTGLIDRLARLFTRPIVRGIQLGLGFILVTKGIAFVRKEALFVCGTGEATFFHGVPVNLIVGF